MLIKAYGQFWNPDIVDWGARGQGNKGQLIGKVRIKSGKGSNKEDHHHEIDFWNAKGIYVLFDRFKCIYVGKALQTTIGGRLKGHLSDRLAGRWDMFSFFSVSTITTTSKGTRDPGKRYVDQDVTINSFEALAILVADPNLNRKRERFKDAHEAIQKKQPNPRTERNYYEEILTKLDQLNTQQQKVMKQGPSNVNKKKKKKSRGVNL